jgi:hypothetical protein
VKTTIQTTAFALMAVLAAGIGQVRAQEGYGTIKGQLIWKGTNIPVLPPLDTQGKDSATCAAKPLANRSLVVDPKTKGVRFGFAYLPRPNGKNPEAAKALVTSAPEVVIDQKFCEFVPYATAFHQDQKLVFKSSDPVIHNVRYLPITNPAQNITLPANGSHTVKLVAERRPIELKCDVHPWMNSWIMVFDHPFFAVTDEEGRFEIKGVPVGEQNLIVWQEKVGYVTPGAARGMAVTVKAGEVTTLPPIEIDPAKVKNLPTAK